MDLFHISADIIMWSACLSDEMLRLSENEISAESMWGEQRNFWNWRRGVATSWIPFRGMAVSHALVDGWSLKNRSMSIFRLWEWALADSVSAFTFSEIPQCEDTHWTKGNHPASLASHHRTVITREKILPRSSFLNCTKSGRKSSLRMSPLRRVSIGRNFGRARRMAVNSGVVKDVTMENYPDHS